MKLFFNWLTIISAIVVIFCVLLQSRGQSLGSSFGGDGNFYRSKRGVERILFNLTIVMGVIFAVSIVLSLLAKK